MKKQPCKRVLIVEDNEDMLSIMRSKLTDIGVEFHSITEANSRWSRAFKADAEKVQFFFADCYEHALTFVSNFTVQKDVSKFIKDVFPDDVMFFLDDDIPLETGEFPQKLGRTLAEGLVVNFGVAIEKIYCISSRGGALEHYPSGCKSVDKLHVVRTALEFIEVTG